MIAQIKKSPQYFIQGAISPVIIADLVAKHSHKKNIGAHEIFLGQVRADNIDGKIVHFIEYTAYREMAESEISKIREQVISTYQLSCAHVLHSIGKVNAGEISLFILASSAHRKAAQDACRELVELIKKNVPVFGKEFFEDDQYRWKANTKQA